METAIIMDALQHLPTDQERFQTLLDYFQQVVRASYIQVRRSNALTHTPRRIDIQQPLLVQLDV
jgi:hypothetical protein